ncbi:YkgJ family cysteine cluster protein, partial [bacterium]|nr:YkgJ family cysteine cluster protein [bacterium]
PANLNCCTGRRVDHPVLTQDDLQRIHSYTGLEISSFSEPDKGSLSNMRSLNGVCYFYKSGKCEIYDQRPIDCRLFPFDVRHNSNGKLILIWYTDSCPQEINAESYISIALTLINEFKHDIVEYSNHVSPLLDLRKYKVVGELVLLSNGTWDLHSKKEIEYV